ncbi:glycosyltransferase [bacterium]|nr:glycosyltransferase [bacterium]
MRILLLGEYSNFHNTLKAGLEKNGHEVLLAGRKDGFKGYPVDIDFDPVLFSKTLFRKVKNFIFLILKIDISTLEIVYTFYRNRKQLKGFDIVQIINEFPIRSTPFIEKKLLNFIFKHNKKVILSACGEDTTYIKYLLKSDLSHHILSPFLRNPKLKPHFEPSLKYLKPSFKKLSEFVIKNVNYIIPGDFDYEMAYRNKTKVKPLIPFPVNTEKNTVLALNIEGKIKIFHGISRSNYYKKGNDIFVQVLEEIQEKYKNKIEIIQVESIPYKDYIELYNESHILLDQTYVYDHGYNALEAMAQGKVVFSGFSDEFKSHYNITKKIGIHTTPNVEEIVKNLSWLIENPKEILEIGKNARAYIEDQHDYIKVAKTYVDTWNSYL